jgi:hypothetical protein
MIKFVDLGQGFFVREDQIQALDYSESEFPNQSSLSYLKVYCGDNIYEFRGERAKYAWVELQKIME